jgi:hypothetical protein
MQEKRTKKFTKWTRFIVSLKKLSAKFDIKKAQFDNMPLLQQKVINIVSQCIDNPDSHLYSSPKNGYLQVELPQIFITVVQENGYYEVDIVYIEQKVPTSDKVIFDASGVSHIFDKFDNEVRQRMKKNMERKEQVVSNYLDNIQSAIETF